MKQLLQAWRVGRIAYGDALRLQERLVEARKADEIPDTLLLLEHPPVVTLGRGAKEENLLLSKEQYEERGIELIETGRGGDVTYHGPGQLVGYPIVDLAPDRQDVRKYVASLEETMIRVANDWGVPAERMGGCIGAWIDPTTRPRKIGAIGVRISRWVTMHGFAFNVTTSLDDFATIVPCGLKGKGVTTLEREMSANVPLLDEVTTRAGEHFAAVHESSLVWKSGQPRV